MIRRARIAGPLQIILIRNRRPARIELVENPLLRRRVSIQIQIVEEWGDGVVGERLGGEGLGFVLAGAFLDAEVAVCAAEALGGGLGVDVHGEGEVDFAVAVVFVCSLAGRRSRRGWGR